MAKQNPAVEAIQAQIDERLERRRQLAHEQDVNDDVIAALETSRDAILAANAGVGAGVKRGRAPTAEVAERVTSLAGLVALHGPMTPTEIARTAAEMLGLTLSITQVQDVLRRNKARFRSLGDGKWEVVGDAANAQGGEAA